MGQEANGDFSDIVEGNVRFVADFSGQETSGLPARKLLLLTCMDCRIVPHEALGASIGDMKVMRNGGAQLNPNMVSDLIVANNVLNCDRILIMPHTRCGMAAATVESVRAAVEQNTGVDASDFHPSVVEHQLEKLRVDVESLRSNPMIKPNTVVQGAMYDVDTGQIGFIEI
jgi:carbonic anhydrase